MICPECYCEHKRITPLLKKEECLATHIQYICGTCGRCICANATDKGLLRFHFPFRTLEIAKYYLRVADTMHKQPCGIYEIISNKGRTAYKIFTNKSEVERYLTKHKDTSCEQLKPCFQMPTYTQYPTTQIRKLNDLEVNRYMEEQNTEACKRTE